MFKNQQKNLLILMSVLSGLSAYAAPVENFGQDLSHLKQAFAKKNVHFLQIGDSHTAADYFTDQLRKRLQAEVGDGGVGFAYPINVNAQRTARHGYQNFGWQIRNSRSDKTADYALGGILAMPNDRQSALVLTSQYYAGDRQHAKIMVKGNIGQNLTVSDIQGTRHLPLNYQGWQAVETTIHFPATFFADGNMRLGGFWLSRSTGGRVSAMGINGATQDFWQRWRSTLSQDFAVAKADLVILAYGTNEAFQPNIHSHIGAVKTAIQQIRQGLPNANILIINPPDSLKSTQGNCGVRANYLNQVQANLRNMAQQYGTLYWSWQEAMGGECSMKSWIYQGLGRVDGVHFSKEGYQKAANDLYDNLKILLNNQNASRNFNDTASLPPPIHTTVSRTTSENGATRIEIQRSYSPVDNTVTISNLSEKRGSAVICSADGKCTQF